MLSRVITDGELKGFRSEKKLSKTKFRSTFKVRADERMRILSKTKMKFSQILMKSFTVTKSCRF
jgi:hypothetical protein